MSGGPICALTNEAWTRKIVDVLSVDLVWTALNLRSAGDSSRPPNGTENFEASLLFSS